MVRINKFLAQCNLGSRRFVESIIKDGLISVNGKIVTDLTYNIDLEKDLVKYNGEEISATQKKIYIMNQISKLLKKINQKQK